MEGVHEIVVEIADDIEMLQYEVQCMQRELDRTKREAAMMKRERDDAYEALGDASIKLLRTQLTLSSVTTEARRDTEELHAKLDRAKRGLREARNLNSNYCAPRPAKRQAVATGFTEAKQ